WSNWLESVQKDMERFFGRLKGQPRILNLPMLYWASRNRLREEINMFFTCCIVQNML
ncbi:unnamed protein product, partial [Discosporangium mesarthrocarpum]